MNPKKIDSAIVGIGLTVFGAFYIFKSGLLYASDDGGATPSVADAKAQEPSGLIRSFWVMTRDDAARA